MTGLKLIYKAVTENRALNKPKIPIKVWPLAIIAGGLLVPSHKCKIILCIFAI
jgi:hypothetical protein